MISPVLLDTSAWNRFRAPELSAERSEELAEATDSGRVVVCLPFLLEAGFTAQNAEEHRLMMATLLGLPRVHLDPRAETVAVEAQRQLARVGHHRIPPADLMLAALADAHELGVLHYDHHYDLIVERTDLRYDSVWLAEPGSL
jgi:predicted nucleic acid-binding protein